MKKYGLGIIGYGGMGSYHHLNLSKADGIEVIGAYDLDEKRLQVAIDNGIKAYPTLEELLSDESIDIVTIATPNNFHKDLAIEAMKNGKHVLCEKPVAMSVEEAQEMIDAAKEYGVVFTVHQNRRMDKDYLMVRQVVEEGLIGKPFSIESRVFGARGIPVGWRCHKEAGGGMVLDWGVHLLDQIMQMMKEKVVSVYANLFSLRYPEVDDFCRIILKFESGATANVEVGTDNFIILPRWYVAGVDGTFIINDWDCENQLVRAKDTEMVWEEEILYTKAGPTKTMAPRAKESTIEQVIEEPSNDYTRTYSNLVAVLEGKEQLLVNPEEALRVMKVIEAAFLSDKTGQAVLDII